MLKSEVSKIFKNVYLNSIITKFNIVIFTFVGSIILNRYLGPSLRGEYAYIINYAGLFSLIVTFSLAQSYPYFNRKNINDINRIYYNIFYFLTILYGVIGYLIILYTESKTIIFIILVTILSQFYQQVSFLATIMDIKKKNKISLIDSYFYLIALGIIFFSESDYQLFFALSIYSIKLIIGIVCYVISYKIYPSFFLPPLKTVIKVFKFSLIPAITAVLINMNYKIDVIIMENFLNFSEIGYYSLGVTLAGMLWVFPDAFKEVLFYKNAERDSLEDIIFSIKFNIYLSVLVIFLFLFLGEFLIEALYGNQFLPSWTVTVILFIGNIPMILFKMINTSFIVQGRQRISLKVLLVAVIINIVGNFFLIPPFGIEGAALASVLSYSISGYILLYIFSKINNFKIREVILINQKDLRQFKWKKDKK